MPRFDVIDTPQGKRLIIQFNQHKGFATDNACVDYILNGSSPDAITCVYDPENFEDTYACRIFNGGVQHNNVEYPGPVYVVADRQEFPWFQFHSRESLLKAFREPDH